MIDCSQATRLTAAGQDRPLRRGERWSLFVHRLVCPACRMYRRQMEILRRTARSLSAEHGGGMDERTRERLRERLRAARQRGS